MRPINNFGPFHWIRVGLLSLMLATMAGCVMTPTWERSFIDYGVEFNPGQLKLLDSRLSREDVIYNFGKPTIADLDQRLLVYSWSRVTPRGGLYVVSMWGGGELIEPGERFKISVLFITYDANQIVTGHELRIFRTQPDLQLETANWVKSHNQPP
jgi:hypothetical protein